MNTRQLKCLLALVTGLALPGAAQAGHFYFPVGITYASGINDAVSALDDLYTAAGYRFEENVVVPIGLSLNPYYEFDNGLAVGLNVGPATVIVLNNRTIYSDGSSDSYDVSYVVPIGADLRYTFLRDKDVSPYLRVGFRYPIVGGRNVESSQVGPVVAVGVDFWRSKKIGMAIEVGYDGSSIEVQGPTQATKDVTYAGFTAGLMVRF